MEWWRSLHQRATITTLDPQIEGDMLVALMVGFLAVGLVFAWLLVHRFRVGGSSTRPTGSTSTRPWPTRRAEAEARRGGSPPSGREAGSP